MSQPAQRHLFIVGFARSGTSLLYNMLNLHPKIKLLFEADLLSNLLVATAIRSGQNWWERLDFYNSTCRRHRLEAQLSWKKIRTTHDAATALYRRYAGSGKLYIGEKSPTYYNCLPELAREFPDARFIMIWRNPSNVISSIIASGEKDYFFSNDSLPLRAIIGFEEMHQDVLALRARNVPVFDLCYEDLVEDPEAWLRPICDFLEIPFDPGMMDLERADCSMFPPGEHHDKVKSGHLTLADRSGQVTGHPIQRKVERYLSRWNELFRDQFTSKRYWQKTGPAKPNLLEVVFDRVNGHWSRFYSEQFTPFVYGFAPLRWLQRYRAWRERGFAPSKFTTPGMPGDTDAHPLKISVITPSYKQLPWLKLCAASVADQKGVTVEHIIQDAQSGPELEEWVHENTRAQLFVECDSGMYDAINRGFARATGDIICWLNSDEQYLEGALARVAQYFETHPDVDVLFGDALLVSNNGSLISYRRTVLPNLHHIQAAHLNTLSCATFIRRSVLERGFNLDTRWKAIADAVWVVSMLNAGIPMAILPEPLAVFTITDKNLGQTSLALSEVKLWQAETASESYWIRPFIVTWHRVIKLVSGAYWPRSMTTRLYTLGSPQVRVDLDAPHIGFSWPRSS